MYNNLTQFEMLTLQQEDRSFYLALAVAVVTFISAIIVYCDYKYRKRKENAEKSIEIAKDFALNIVKPLSKIHSFFKHYKINEILNKVNFLELEDFDIEELNELYSQEDIEKYQKIIAENIDNEQGVDDAICNVLNALEYECMYIRSKVADDKYIYNSLHQQFLKSIALLYFEISLINTDNKDKYYTNVIHVYNLWKKRYLKSIKRENKILRKQGKLENKRKKLKKKLPLPSPQV